jgi:3-oxoacyl-[acyl-carrier protein] reductase
MAKVAIVTGGARGIGRSCALTLAERGYDIALVDLRAPEMRRTATEIENRGRSALQFEADVSSFDAARQAVAEIVAAWGRIDFLLNNAAIAAPKGLLEITEAEWDRTIDVNLKSCFVWCRHVAPIMLDAGEGRIVSMSSVNAFTGGVTAAVSKFAYAAAKAGILGLTRSLAKELGPAITVNAVCPGVIKTEEGNTLVNAREAELAQGNALKRLGTPRDVAELVVFLATADPSYITGQSFVADGFQWNT